MKYWISKVAGGKFKAIMAYGYDSYDIIGYFNTEKLAIESCKREVKKNKELFSLYCPNKWR